MRSRTRNLAFGAVLLVALVTLAVLFVRGTADSGQSPSTARQSEIASKGRQVMPFDLERTTHRFEKAEAGGVQTVVADDPKDQQQIALIRGHLKKEAEGFSRGDFTDPASIHGTDMPGLQRLQREADRLQVRYADLPAGARITYTTSDTALAHALHAWFDAQVSDHGSHAEHG